MDSESEWSESRTRRSREISSRLTYAGNRATTRSLPARLTAQTARLAPRLAAANHTSWPSGDQARPRVELKRLEMVRTLPERSTRATAPAESSKSGWSRKATASPRGDTLTASI